MTGEQERGKVTEQDGPQREHTGDIATQWWLCRLCRNGGVHRDTWAGGQCPGVKEGEDVMDRTQLPGLGNWIDGELDKYPMPGCLGG